MPQSTPRSLLPLALLAVEPGHAGDLALEEGAEDRGLLQGLGEMVEGVGRLLGQCRGEGLGVRGQGLQPDGPEDLRLLG